MKDLSENMQSHLESGVTTLCHCWRLIRSDGLVLGFTNHDRDLMFDGVLYEAAAGFQASEMTSALGLNIDNMEIEGALSSSRLGESALSAGLFDGAVIELLVVNWAAPEQRVLLRRGHLGEVRRGDVAFVAEIRGIAHELNQTRGRIYQYSCDAVLGDARCGVDLKKPVFSTMSVVMKVESRRRFIAAGLHDFVDDWFSRGLISWIDGVNAGCRMEVRAQYRSMDGVHVELWRPMSMDIAIGDGFTIQAGCDKQPDTCRMKFSNLVNYRGFPKIPGDDLMMSSSVRGDGNHGGSGSSL